MKKFALMLCLMAGCKSREGMPSVAENGEDRVCLVAIGTDDDQAIDFAVKLVERFVRDSPQDKLIIARLGDADFLRWEGRAGEVKRLCPTPQELKALLSRKEILKPTRLYPSLRDCMKFLMANPRVQADRAKPIVYVLSSMADDGTFEERANLSYFIGEVGWKHGEMRMYFVNADRFDFCQAWLAQMRVQKSAVFSSAQGQPPVPSS